MKYSNIVLVAVAACTASAAPLSATTGGNLARVHTHAPGSEEIGNRGVVGSPHDPSSDEGLVRRSSNPSSRRSPSEQREDSSGSESDMDVDIDIHTPSPKSREASPVPLELLHLSLSEQKSRLPGQASYSSKLNKNPQTNQHPTSNPHPPPNQHPQPSDQFVQSPYTQPSSQPNSGQVAESLNPYNSDSFRSGRTRDQSTEHRFPRDRSLSDSDVEETVVGRKRSRSPNGRQG